MTLTFVLVRFSKALNNYIAWVFIEGYSINWLRFWVTFNRIQQKIPQTLTYLDHVKVFIQWAKWKVFLKRQRFSYASLWCIHSMVNLLRGISFIISGTILWVTHAEQIFDKKSYLLCLTCQRCCTPILSYATWLMARCDDNGQRLTPSMMTSSNGNIFRVTGHLCGEFTGLRWIPRTKASDAELLCFLWSASE